MKLATIVIDGVNTLAVATADQKGAIPISTLLGGGAPPPTTMRELIALGPHFIDVLQAAAEQSDPSDAIRVGSVSWRAPVPDPGKIIGVAMNNARLNAGAHVAPAGPMFFIKPSSSLIGHNEAIEIGSDYGFTFPELELGVVIGKRTKHVSQDEALDHIFGYTIVNDVTSQGLKHGDSIAVDLPRAMRDTPGYDEYFSWRRSKGDDDLSIYFTYHARSKGSDTFGPMGPWITTRDEIADPDALEVSGYADGEMFALDNTASYSYPVAEIISYASRYFTLEPGDIITCGTAAKGVGRFARAHHDIDMSKATPVVEIEIEGLGRLANPVKHTGEI